LQNSIQEFLSVDKFQGSVCLKLQGNKETMKVLDTCSSKTEKLENKMIQKEDDEILTNFFKICKAKNKIKKIILKSFDFENVDISVLVNLVKNLESLDLAESTLTASQLGQIVEAVHTSRTIRSLSLQGIISRKSAQNFQFSMIGKNLEHFHLSKSCLSEEQSINLLEGLAKAKRLKTLRITDTSGIETVSGDVLAACISKNIKCLDLTNTWISDTAVEAVMTNLLQESHCLDTLCLNNIRLEKILWNPEWTTIMASNSILQLRECLPKDRGILETLLRQILLQKKVKRIDLGLINMSSVDQSLMLQSLAGMKYIDLSGTSLTNDQIQTLLGNLTKNSEIEELKFSNNDLCHIELPVLDNLVANLKHLHLESTNLQPIQIDHLIRKSTMENSRLEKLELGDFKMSKTKHGFEVTLTKQEDVPDPTKMKL